MQFQLRCVLALLFLLITGAVQAESWGLYIMPAHGGEPRLLTGHTGDFYGSPCWSPDGKTVAFDTWKLHQGEDLNDARIATISSAGGEITRLGTGAMPSFSPDGSQLVFHTYSPNSQTVVMNSDGSGHEVVAPGWWSPRWSPDGRSVVAIFSGTISQMQLSTGRQKVLVGPGINVRQGLSISPNSKRIAYSDTHGIVVASKPEEGPYEKKRLVTWEHTLHSTWFPDNQRLVFVGQAEDEDGVAAPLSRLYSCNADDGSVPEEIPGIPETWSCGDPNLSKDGKLLIFNALVPDAE